METSKVALAELTLKEKIQIERRKRYQTYTALNYLVSSITYFDFFSLDAFNIAKKSKYLGQVFNKKDITSEFLIIPFLEINSEISEILDCHSITLSKVQDLVCSLNKKTVRKLNMFEKIQENLFKNKIYFQKDFNYSYEVNLIFEKASENALNRFKTPVITSEILFLTILEEKNSRGGKLLKKLLKTDSEWFLLRYKILKKLHNQEVQIRNSVLKNQHYFGYLMKTQLSDKEFEKLLEKKLLENSVSTFRNLLVLEILKEDIFDILEKDVKRSIVTTSSRKYSN